MSVTEVFRPDAFDLPVALDDDQLIVLLVTEHGLGGAPLKRVGDNFSLFAKDSIDVLVGLGFHRRLPWIWTKAQTRESYTVTRSDSNASATRYGAGPEELNSDQVEASG